MKIRYCLRTLTFGVFALAAVTGVPSVNGQSPVAPSDALLASDAGTKVPWTRRGTRASVSRSERLASLQTSGLRRGSRTDPEQKAVSVQLPVSTPRRGSR